MIRKLLLLLLLLDPDQGHASTVYTNKTDILLWVWTPRSSQLAARMWPARTPRSCLSADSVEAAEMWALPCFCLPSPAKLVWSAESKLLPEPSCRAEGGMVFSFLASVHVNLNRQYTASHLCGYSTQLRTPFPWLRFSNNNNNKTKAKLIFSTICTNNLCISTLSWNSQPPELWEVNVCC